MNDLAQKLEYLKWLKIMGIEYYFSDKKDSNILLPSLCEGSGRSLSVSEGSSAKNRDLSPIGKEVPRLEANLLALDPQRCSGSAQKLDNIDSVDKLREIVENFKGCSLKDFALNTVFADGMQNAKIMLIGEAPGAKEDEQGIPFCGESGVLLDTMLAAIGLSRKENIYITNTIFWRPPANRTPTKEEKEICKPFLEKHIALINPKLIICVGSTAVTGVLGDKVTINEARSNMHFYQNKYLTNPINTIAIFHPAYLLRQGGRKKDAWFDLIKIQQFIEENI